MDEKQSAAGAISRPHLGATAGARRDPGVGSLALDPGTATKPGTSTTNEPGIRLAEPRVVPGLVEQPLVFFMPSAEGDAPAYVRFRHTLQNRVRFSVIDYPPWREMIDKGAGFHTIVDAAVEQIIRESGGRTCFLAGYSFGGFVAWATARRLTELGQRVGFVGLIDTRWQQQLRQTNTFMARLRRKIHYLLSRPGDAFAEMNWRLVYPRVVRHCPTSLLRALGELAITTPMTSTFGVRLLVQLRLLAMNGWAPKPLDAPTYLFRSDEFNPQAPDFGWGALCNDVKVIPVGGSHLSLFDPPTIHTLCDRFQDSVQAATRLAYPASTQ